MPLIYDRYYQVIAHQNDWLIGSGEGDKAFQRLQREIMRNTEDYATLAWGILNGSIRAENDFPEHWKRWLWAQCNPLATSPSPLSIHRLFSHAELTYEITDNWVGQSISYSRTADHEPPTLTA